VPTGQEASSAQRDKEHGSCATNEILSKIAITALADAEQAGLAAGRHLTRRQPEPRRHVPSAPEGTGVADGGRQRGRVRAAKTLGFYAALSKGGVG